MVKKKEYFNGCLIQKEIKENGNTVLKVITNKRPAYLVLYLREYRSLRLSLAPLKKDEGMRDYEINVTQIEELQTIKDIETLNQIFDRAYKTVIGGATVVLLRKNGSGKGEKFDELTTEGDLLDYKNRVFKYL